MRGAVILSGGTGKRLGGKIPKQYLEVKDKKVIFWCLDRFIRSFNGEQTVDALVITADRAYRDDIEKYIDENSDFPVFKGFADPGENRQLSIYNGLLALKGILGDSDPVMIHDAARPLVREEHILEVFRAAEGHDGAMPSLPMKDTVYLSHDGKCISSLLNRSEIFAGQAPEVFSFGKYLKANEALLPEKILLINGSAEPAVLFGMDIAMLPGDEGNFKITTAKDLARFGEIVGR